MPVVAGLAACCQRQRIVWSALVIGQVVRQYADARRRAWKNSIQATVCIWKRTVESCCLSLASTANGSLP
jgi:hypothetical protein